MNIGDTYYDFGEHENAIPYFQKAIQLDPDHANARTCYWVCHIGP